MSESIPIKKEEDKQEEEVRPTTFWGSIIGLLSVDYFKVIKANKEIFFDFLFGLFVLYLIASLQLSHDNNFVFTDLKTLDLIFSFILFFILFFVVFSLTFSLIKECRDQFLLNFLKKTSSLKNDNREIDTHYEFQRYFGFSALPSIIFVLVVLDSVISSGSIQEKTVFILFFMLFFCSFFYILFKAYLSIILIITFTFLSLFFMNVISFATDELSGFPEHETIWFIIPIVILSAYIAYISCQQLVLTKHITEKVAAQKKMGLFVLFIGFINLSKYLVKLTIFCLSIGFISDIEIRKIDTNESVFKGNLVVMTENKIIARDPETNIINSYGRNGYFFQKIKIEQGKTERKPLFQNGSNSQSSYVLRLRFFEQLLFGRGKFPSE